MDVSLIYKVLKVPREKQARIALAAKNYRLKESIINANLGSTGMLLSKWPVVGFAATCVASIGLNLLYQHRRLMKQQKWEYNAASDLTQWEPLWEKAEAGLPDWIPQPYVYRFDALNKATDSMPMLRNTLSHTDVKAGPVSMSIKKGFATQWPVSDEQRIRTLQASYMCAVLNALKDDTSQVLPMVIEVLNQLPETLWVWPPNENDPPNAVWRKTKWADMVNHAKSLELQSFDYYTHALHVFTQEHSGATSSNTEMNSLFASVTGP